MMKCLLRLHVTSLMSTVLILREKRKLLHTFCTEKISWGAFQSMKCVLHSHEGIMVSPIWSGKPLFQNLYVGRALVLVLDILAARILGGKNQQETHS